jgi:fused signal recognition particle receptor
MTSSEKKIGWFDRLKSGLAKTTQALGVFSFWALDAQALEDLEERLIESDLGVEAAAEITQALARQKINGEDDVAVKTAMAEAIYDILKGREDRFAPLSGPKPYVVMFVGVNGSGKTTTLGKIAADLVRKGAKVLIVAGDTFRAAAVEQLKVWADRAGADFMGRDTGADAAGLAFDAVERAKLEAYDVVLIDTAGRLQNKTALMDELLKIVRVIKKNTPDAPHETLLVLDATVGRNALSQEQIFGRTAMVTGLVMTKLDGTSRGGILVPIAKASDAPIKLIGVGEDIEDLQDFDAKAFARSMVGLN